VFAVFPRLAWNSRLVNMLHLTLFLLTLQSVISVLVIKRWDVAGTARIQMLLSLILGLLLLVVSVVIFMRSEKLSLYPRVVVCAALLCPVLYLWGHWFAGNFALLTHAFFVNFWSSAWEIAFALAREDINLAQFLTSVVLTFLTSKPKIRETANRTRLINWLFILCAVLVSTSYLAISNTDYLTFRTVWFYFGFFLSMGVLFYAAAKSFWRDTLAGDDISVMIALFMFAFIMTPSITKYFAQYFNLVNRSTVVFLAFFGSLGILFSAMSVRSDRIIMTFTMSAVILSILVNLVDADWEKGGQTTFTGSGEEQFTPSAISEMVRIKENERVSVYSLTYDSAGDLQALESVGVNTEPLVNLLRKNDFKIYYGTYTLYSDSLGSMSRTYDISNAPSSRLDGQNAPESQSDFLSSSMERNLLSGSAKVFQIFAHNGYGTASIQSSYMTGGKIFVDEYWPPIDKRGHEIKFTVALIRCILFGEFREDMEFVSIYSESTYHEFLRSKMAVKSGPWFTAMHAGLPGHSQNSGKLLPNETELFIGRFNEALKYMEGDIRTILENDPSAVIVILGDHGPYLTGDGINLTRYLPEDISELMIRDRYGTLVAIRWPDRVRAEKYDKDLIVNQDIFPVVFSYLADSPEPLKLMIKNKKAVLKNHVFIDNGVFMPYTAP
jgi:hypothetical protein